MAKGKVRHLFPGGNTSLGFFSYYEYILSQEDATRIIVIKGGPGVGKSTFMKKIGAEMIDRGYDVEFMHCSSDNNSLDGVVIPAAKVALIDGTAPHIVDPKNPGAVDEIINFGEYWDEEGIRKYKKEVISDNKEVGKIFARAYRYLKAAAAIYEDTAVIYGWAINSAKVNAVTSKIINALFTPEGIAVKEGRQRHLFASAITPDGLKNYLDSLLTTEKVYEIKGQQGTGTEKVLEKIRTAAIERGYYVESYYCALNPHKLEHLVIPDLDVSFTTSNKYHSAAVDIYAEINLDEYLNQSVIEAYSDTLEYNKTEFDALLVRAVRTVSKAKAMHDHMETYYIPNMDFEAVQLRFEDTLARILRYTAENV